MAEPNLTRNIQHCARCHQDHQQLTFRKLTNPVRIFEDIDKPKNSAFTRNPTTQLYSHWAPCPTNGEPILMRFGVGPACCVGGRCRSRAQGHRGYLKPVIGQPVTQEQLDRLKEAESVQ